MDDKPESLRRAGWDGLLSWHEAGHGVMLLHEGRPFDKIDMRPNPERGYDAAVLGQEIPLTTPGQITGEMKVAAAGPAAGRKGCQSVRRYRPLGTVEIRDEISTGTTGCDFGLVARLGADLDFELVRLGRGLESGIEHWITVCELAEREITGPLWRAVEALAVALLPRRRALGDLAYEEAAAIVGPLLADAA